MKECKFCEKVKIWVVDKLVKLQQAFSRGLWMGIFIPLSLLIHLPGILIGLLYGVSVLGLGKWSKNDKMAKYGWNILITHDQVGNTLFAGDPDETISSRTGKMQKTGAFWARALCWVLNKLDTGHCVDAEEGDEGKDKIID